MTIGNRSSQACRPDQAREAPLTHAQARRRRAPWEVVTLARLIAVLLAGVLVSARAEPPTYSGEVAAILRQKCQDCHQPGSIAPMSLRTFEETQPWAPLIRMRVQAREMPPWHLNPTIGIQHYRNDRGLTEAERQTLIDWVEAGAPLGSRDQLPPPQEAKDPNRWQLGDLYGREPDLIIRSGPYDLEPITQDKWFQPVVDSGLTEDRWVRGIEIRPSYPLGRQAVHHAMAYLVDGNNHPAATGGSTRPPVGHDQAPFAEWAVGKVGEIYPADTGKLLKAGSRIGWDLHLHAIGRQIEGDVVELGLWFYPPDAPPRQRTELRSLSALGEGGIDIRPHETAMVQQFHVVEEPVRLENFQPHMHRVGKGMSMEVIYPDGQREVLSYVDNFQWQWHNNYIYADDAAPLLPAGSILVITAWYDNTENNPNAPDPRQWVGYGDRTVDEMGHAWVNFTFLTQDEFDRQLAQRQARQLATQAQ